MSAVTVGGTLSPNVLIIGAVAGLGLVLLWKLTDGGTKGPGDAAAGAVGGYLKKHNAQMKAVGGELPFSPFWWWAKIENAYTDDGQN